MLLEFSGVCIWCLRETNDVDLEHIFPESLGCPAHFVLPGSCVCRKCNNDLAPLDRSVADDFDFVALMYGVTRKKGRSPEIASRGNVYGRVGLNGAELYFNCDPKPSEGLVPGRRVAAYRGQPRDIKPTFTMDNGVGGVQFSAALGKDPRFVRGILKIAMSCLAYILGPEEVVKDRYENIRTYVRHGKGRRHVLMTESGDACYKLAAYGPWATAEGDLAIEIRVGVVSFLVDLSRDECLLQSWVGKKTLSDGVLGWTVLPPLNQY